MAECSMHCQTLLIDRPYGEATLSGLETGEPLVTILIQCPQVASGEDHDIAMLVRDRCRVDLPQVGGEGLPLSAQRHLHPIIDHQMPAMSCGDLIVDQPHLDKGGLGEDCEIGRQNDSKWLPPTGVGQQQPAIFEADARCFPDRGTVERALIRILRTVPAVDFCRLAGIVECLLCRIPAMGVQGGGTERVVDFFGSGLREPVVGAAIDTIVPDQGVGVDAPALAIQCVGLTTGQMAIQISYNIRGELREKVVEWLIQRGLTANDIVIDTQTRERIPDVFDTFKPDQVVSSDPIEGAWVVPGGKVVLGVRGP